MLVKPVLQKCDRPHFSDGLHQAVGSGQQGPYMKAAAGLLPSNVELQCLR